MAEERILARILRQHGGNLLDKAIDSALPPEKEGKPSWSRKLGRIALLRIATRSVPGAIIVGGSIAIKHLHNRRKAGKAAGQAPVKKPAKK